MALRKRVLILSVVAVLGAGCGGGDDGGSADGDTGSGAATLTAADFAFDPSSLSAAPGDTIEFVNEDDAEHNFTAEEAGLDVDVDGGATTTIDLAGVEAGSYDFFCEYHKDSMTGTLEVTG